MVLLLLLLLLLHELFRREQNFDDAVKVLKPKTLPAMIEEEEGEERKCCRKSIRSKVYFLCLSEEKRAVNTKKIRLAYYPICERYNVSDGALHSLRVFV